MRRTAMTPGEEERFREYAERMQRLHAEQEARKAAAQTEPRAELPVEEVEARLRELRRSARRITLIAGAAAAVVALVVLVVAVMEKPVIREVVPDPAQVTWAEVVGLPVEVRNSIGMRFRLIPPGSFTMGSPQSEWGHREEEYQRLVNIRRPFYVAVEETTQAVYEQVMATNPSFFAAMPQNPVEYVTFDDAVRFCNELSRREGLAPAYEGGEGTWVCRAEREGYRLPFEAEWEYACRAGTREALYAGSIASGKAGAENLWRAAWYLGNSDGRPHPVAQREPNPWGLYDMLGNVGEWCNDWYTERSPTRLDNILGASSGEGRVVRGGSWYSEPGRCRSASRRRWDPAIPWNAAGFRCVRTVNVAVPARP